MVIILILVIVYLAVGLLFHYITTPDYIVCKFGDYTEELSTELWTDLLLWLPILLIMGLVKLYYLLSNG